MLVQLTPSIIREFRWPPIFRISANSDVASILDRYGRGTWGIDYFSGIEGIPDEQALVSAYSDYEKERVIKMQEEEKEGERKRNERKFFEWLQTYYSNVHKLNDFIQKNSHLLYAIDTKWFHVYLTWLPTGKKFSKKGFKPCREIGEMFIAELEKRGEYNQIAKQIWLKFLQKNSWEK